MVLTQIFLKSYNLRLLSEQLAQHKKTQCSVYSLKGKELEIFKIPTPIVQVFCILVIPHISDSIQITNTNLLFALEKTML